MDKLQHIRLAVPDILVACDNGIGAINKLVYKVRAEVVNIFDDVIVKACVDAAKEVGATDLILIDKTFLLDALKRAMGGGQWITRESPGHIPVIACSECGTMYQRRHKAYLSYCPNCGMNMMKPINTVRGCDTCEHKGWDMPQCRALCNEKDNFPYYVAKTDGEHDA